MPLTATRPKTRPAPRRSRMLLPEYSESFRCIGPACEDTCCAGWGVPIDRVAYEKYRSLPESPLKILLNDNLELTPDDPNPNHHARVRMPASLVCPFLNEERLCSIQAAHGEEYLSITCSTYPRAGYTVDGLTGKALSLSCPEAARLVLLDPHLLRGRGAGGYQISWDDRAEPGEATLLPYFWPIREFVLDLVGNRAYPLWQRLFLLGTFCRRLQGFSRGEMPRGFPAFFREFASAVSSGGLRAAMERIAPHPGLQLEIVLGLIRLGGNRPNIGPRFVETIRAFVQGIGIGQGGELSLNEQIARYGSAYREHFEPFFASHPHILENYLSNAIFAKAFPFGARNGVLAGNPQAAREFALLATQFALIKGLLIGVAGFYKENFAAEHVIQTVQSASKHFEHHPEFLDQAHALLTARGLDNAPGLTMLLRN